MKTIILASASPRRRELLEQIGLSFFVEPAEGEEVVTAISPPQIVEELSSQKAREVAGRHKEEDILIIGADTIVVFQGKIMGKPQNREDARRMLQILSGRTHEVYTGVTVILRDQGKETIQTFSESTKVSFYNMTDADIEAYISTGEPMDKAGAYGIQGIGARYIRSISGDYNNVVGLPIGRLWQEVLKFCDQ